MLSTNHPRWRNVVSTIFFTLACVGMVGCFWYLYLSLDSIGCYKSFLSMSVIWLVAELFVITYLFLFKNIPVFARESIVIVIAFSNVWFGLFIFSLKPCGV